MFEDDEYKMTDDEFIEYIHAYKSTPHMTEKYENKYKELYDKKESGEKINREYAEHLQNFLTQRGSRFVQFHRIFPNE